MAGVRPNQLLASIERKKSYVQQGSAPLVRFQGDLKTLQEELGGLEEYEFESEDEEDEEEEEEKEENVERGTRSRRFSWSSQPSASLTRRGSTESSLTKRRRSSLRIGSAAVAPMPANDKLEGTKEVPERIGVIFAEDIQQRKSEAKIENASPTSGDRKRRVSRRWRKARAAAKTISRIKAMEKDMRLYGTRPIEIDDEDGNYGAQVEKIDKKWYILLPRNRFRRLWELSVITMLLYVVVTVPVRVCFNIQPEGAADMFDLLIDVLFILDVFINMICAYHSRTGELVVSQRLILVHYAKTWMILDVIASVPVYRFIDFDANVENAQIKRLSKLARLPRLFRLIRLLRLLKLLRVIKLMRYFNQWEQLNIGLNVGLTRIFKVAFIVFMVTHLIGCFWYFMAWAGNVNDELYEDSWVIRHGIENASSMTKYVTSVYWAFSTLTTVGFGDISAYTNSERFFSIFVMIAGVSWYAFIISTISSIISMFDRRNAIIKRKQRLLSEFMREARMPWDLRRRIFRYFDFVTSIEGGDGDSREMEGVLSMLSAQLRTEVTLHVHRQVIPQIPFFLNKSPQFIASTVTLLRPLQFLSGDYISTRGQHADEMYFLVEGRTVVILEDGTKFKSMIAGSYFGEIGCLLSERHRVSIVAVVDCEMQALSKIDLRALMDEYPDVASEIRLTAKKRIDHLNSLRDPAIRNQDPAVLHARNFATSFPGVCLEADDDHHHHHGEGVHNEEMLTATSESMDVEDIDIPAGKSEILRPKTAQELFTRQESFATMAESLYEDTEDHEVAPFSNKNGLVETQMMRSIGKRMETLGKSLEILHAENRELRKMMSEILENSKLASEPRH